MTGPWRATWARTTTSLNARLLVVLSLTLVLSILTFFTSEMHPLDHPWAWIGFRPGEMPFVPALRPRSPAALLAAGGTSQDIAEALGMSSILLQSSLLMALLLLAIRRWGAKLPLGWLTFIFVLNALGMSIFHTTFWAIPIAGITGLIVDALYRWFRPDPQRTLQFRLFAATVPLVLYSLYFLALFMIGGVWWPIHLWTGGIALAGVAGWLMSYLVLPPALPAREQSEPVA